MMVCVCGDRQHKFHNTYMKKALPRMASRLDVHNHVVWQP
jgi:hypothetical protein